MMLVRRLRRSPAARASRCAAPGLRLRPRASGRHLGQQPRPLRDADLTLRLTTDAVDHRDPRGDAFFLEDTATLLLGPDETVHGAVGETGRRFARGDRRYWREWVRFLASPSSGRRR
jgi:hypothetical protein